MRAFALVQLFLLAACWAINVSPAGLCVSFLIVALVPLRERVIPRVFSDEELKVLDAECADKAHDAVPDDAQTFS